MGIRRKKHPAIAAPTTAAGERAAGTQSNGWTDEMRRGIQHRWADACDMESTHGPLPSRESAMALSGCGGSLAMAHDEREIDYRSTVIQATGDLTTSLDDY